MTKGLLLLALLALVLAGCAFGLSHGTTGKTTTMPDETVVVDSTSYHGWSIVWGGGTTGAKMEAQKADLNTADTGFSDNAAPTFKALGEAIGEGFAAASGTGSVGGLVDAIVEAAEGDGD